MSNMNLNPKRNTWIHIQSEPKTMNSILMCSRPDKHSGFGRKNSLGYVGRKKVRGHMLTSMGVTLN